MNRIAREAGTELIPSPSFCACCVSKDIRVLKDNFNAIFITLTIVAEELAIYEDDWEKRFRRLEAWAAKKKRDRVKLEMAEANKKMKKQASTERSI